MRKIMLLISMIMAIVPTAFAADKEKTVNTLPITRLSMDKANELALAAVKACRKKGIQIAATVVDRNGIVQVTMRDTIAAPLTVKVSTLKAYTAVNFNVDTSQLARQSKSPLAHVPGLMFSPGGVAVKVGGKLVAGIGVSGAPSGKTDEECAKAGVSKLVGDLEMDI